MIGARHFLIAYNVNLKTPDVEVARQIARKIRESSGGFRFVKAMGLYLGSANRAQVSMNLTNFAEIPLDDLYAPRLGLSCWLDLPRSPRHRCCTTLGRTARDFVTYDCT